jgi:hypothetical protein
MGRACSTNGGEEECIYTQWEVGPIDVQHNDKKQTAASSTRIELTENKRGNRHDGVWSHDEGNLFECILTK